MRSRHLIREIIVILTAVLCFVAAGCSSIKNPAAIPYSNSDFQGMAYEDALSAIQEAGFINIQEKMLNPFIGTPGTVESVSVNGKYIFSKGQKWENDVPVIVTYFRTEEEAQGETVESAEESSPEPGEGKELLEVTFDLEVTGEEGKPIFIVETNLPDDTEIAMYLFGDELYYDEQFLTVKGGRAESEPFTNEGAALNNYTIFGITVLPTNQPENVQTVLGAKGEYITGPFVIDAGYCFAVSFEKDFRKEQEEESGAPEEKLSEADMKAILESAIAAGFGDNCSVFLDGKIFTINAWQDGMAMTVILAQGGSAEAALAWNQVRTSTIEASNSLQNLLNNNGFSDYLAVVNVLNDMNRENILLCVMGGMVVTDAAE